MKPTCAKLDFCIPLNFFSGSRMLCATRSFSRYKLCTHGASYPTRNTSHVGKASRAGYKMLCTAVEQVLAINYLLLIQQVRIKDQTPNPVVTDQILDGKFNTFMANLPHSLAGEDGWHQIRHLMVQSNKLQKYQNTIHLSKLVKDINMLAVDAQTATIKVLKLFPWWTPHLPLRPTQD